MSAFFHEVGRRRSKKEEFKMSATGAANKSAFSFNTQEGIPSSPAALFVLSADSFSKTENSDIDGEDLVGMYTRAGALVHQAWLEG